MRELGILAGGAVAAAGGRITAVGSLQQVRDQVRVGPNTRQLDAGGRLVTPGLVDAHTHLVYAGSREEEFVLKTVEGLSYEEIAKRGGGIPVTVAATRAASGEELLARARAVVARMFAGGTTTLEAKSGYALEPEGELRLLETVRALDREGPAGCVPTFFGTHEVPAEYAGRREEYLRLVVERMLPEAAARGLAKFCDSGTAFPPGETAALYRAAKAHGLGLKVHADEFRAAGGAELAAEWKAVSAEHCIHSTDEGIQAMARAGVIAVLLPAVPLVHRLPRAADARRFLHHGAAVALGSDYNPSCPVESMALVLSLACYLCGMSPEEALCAATLNAACASGCGWLTGSLETGKQADLVVWQVSNHRQLAERLGGNLAAVVIKKGRVFG